MAGDGGVEGGIVWEGYGGGIREKGETLQDQHDRREETGTSEKKEEDDQSKRKQIDEDFD